MNLLDRSVSHFFFSSLWKWSIFKSIGPLLLFFFLSYYGRLLFLKLTWEMRIWTNCRWLLLTFEYFLIDYRCEDGCFPVSASCLTISNPDSLSSSETGNNPGIRSWKKHSSDWARCQKAVGGIYFTKKRRVETLQPGSEFDNFKHQLKSGCLQMHLLAERFLFWKGFLKEEVKTYVLAPRSPVNSIAIFTSIMYE